MVIFNNTSADFVFISADVLLKISGNCVLKMLRLWYVPHFSWNEHFHRAILTSLKSFWNPKPLQIMAWSSRKNFGGTGKERTGRELDNLLPMLYLLRLVGASPEIGNSRKKDRKGKRPYDLLLIPICTWKGFEKITISPPGLENLPTELRTY